MGGKTAGGALRTDRRRAARIAALLGRHYPDAAISLDFSNPFELLVATILSAQCTDVRVNLVTPALFRRYRSTAEFARADLDELMALIRSTGFFRNKARSIVAAAGRIEELHGGAVPPTMKELVALPGIGRKTANVILGNAFGIPGMVVDTHIGRISRRLGLTDETDPVKVERDLMELFPQRLWTLLSHQFIAHGRSLCRAPKPRCGECFLTAALCPSRPAGL